MSCPKPERTLMVVSLLAFSKAVFMYGLVRPQMDPRPILDIRGGRHLIVEACVQAGQFVVNDTKMLSTTHHELSNLVRIR